MPLLKLGIAPGHDFKLSHRIERGRHDRAHRIDAGQELWPPVLRSQARQVSPIFWRIQYELMQRPYLGEGRAGEDTVRFPHSGSQSLQRDPERIASGISSRTHLILLE